MMTEQTLWIMLFAIFLFGPIMAFIITVYVMRCYRNFQLVRAYRAQILESDKYGYSPLMFYLHLKHPVDHQGNPIWIEDILPGRTIYESSVQQALTRIYMEYDVAPHQRKLW